MMSLPDWEFLLEAWDQGAQLNPSGQALAILGCAYPERSIQELAGLNIIQRDLELLKLRQRLFGDLINIFMSCAHCGMHLEFSIPASSVLSSLADQAERVVQWNSKGFHYNLRLINSFDLSTVIDMEPEQNAQFALLEKCLTITATDTDQRTPDPSEYLSTAMSKFNKLLQDAEIVLNVQCPACLQTVHTELDICSFLWREIRHAANSLLAEVHELARTYGWAETAILSMSPARRHAYLDMVRL